jgi:hypothetical protein
MTAGSGWDGILEPGETILWQGQPVPGIIWRDMINARLPMGIIFTGFSTVWITLAIWMATSIEAPILMRLLFPTFGLPFLGIGLYMLAGHLLWDAMVRRGTWYTLTDRTAFVATDILGRRKLDSFPIATMAPAELIDGNPGDVIFGMAHHGFPDPVAMQGGPGKRLMIRTGATTGFRRITEARTVWRLLRDRQAALRAGRGGMDRDETA